MARPTLPSHRKFLKLAARLQSEALALGHLEFIWHAANESGNPVLGDADDVEALARWRGARGELTAALLEAGSAGGAGFIELAEDGRYVIHDYWHHAPDYANTRRDREEERTRAKSCEVCGGPFHSRDVRRKTCSPACRSKAYRDRVRDDRDGDREQSDGNRDGSGQIRDGSLNAPKTRVTDRDARDGLVTDSATEVRHTSRKVTDRHGTPAPAPAPAQLREETTSENSRGGAKGSSSINGVGQELSTGTPQDTPPQDPRSFDTIKANVLAVAERFRTTDPAAIVKLGGAGYRISPRQAEAAITQLRQDGMLRSIEAAS